VYRAFSPRTGGGWISILILACTAISLAGIGQIKTYTSKRDLRGLLLTRGTLWAATSGGLFSFTIHDSTYGEFTTSEGLQTNDLTAITIDAQGTLWTGASNGFLHAYDPVLKRWQYVSDIYLLSASQKRINALVPVGDSLFICSDVGVSLFSVSRMEFIDTYRRFGASPNQLVGDVTDVRFYGGRLWVATAGGIASTPVLNQNPSSPESWKVSSVADGLARAGISALASMGGLLFAATDSGLSYSSGSRWATVPGTRGLTIRGMTFDTTTGLGSSDHLFYFTADQLWASTDSTGGGLVATGFPSTLSSVAAAGPGYYLGTRGTGILAPVQNVWLSLYPPGPPTNEFVSLAVDQNGVLWAGTGPVSTTGFLRFDGRTWRTYNQQTDTILHTGSAYRVDIGTGNTKWISLFGKGVAMVGPNDKIARVLYRPDGLSYTTNTSNDSLFVVVAGVATDRSGHAWINVRTANDNNLVAIYTPGVTGLTFVHYPQSNPPILTGITADTYGTLWFTTYSDVHNPSPGLVFYDSSKQLPGRLSGATGWGVVSASDGLTDNEISAVAVDNDGNLWVGSSKGGISIIVDPTNPAGSILFYHPLRDQKINQILVDPINNKWVATENGVFVMSPDGTSILNSYTVESTHGQLPDDRVTSLAFSPNTGIIYIGTGNGLVSLATTSVAPVRSFSKLTFSPNPYRVPSDSRLVVDGLVEGSSLKILSVDGKLIRELDTPGGRTGFWDGTDNRGSLVGTGIYLVIAYSSDGSTAAAGKVAVIRK